MSSDRYDVAIVGGSTAGCTAARLFAEQGARVALIEKRPSLDAYKTVCTHYIQSSATPVIERIGLAPLLEERGAVHNSADIWTEHGGWMHHRGNTPYGYNVTRRTLDPLLRKLAADTPGVNFMPGWTATGIVANGRVGGVEIADRSRTTRRLTARLVVAADGRDSGLARLAGVPGRVKPHERFFYWGYWRGVEPAGDRSRMWFFDDGRVAYTFPNEDDLTVVLAGARHDRLPEFRADLEGAFTRHVASLPDGPDLTRASREGKLLGKLALPNVSRPAARPGLAFVGDAALASDPVWGVGCGWAFQSAEWLVDETAEGARGDADLDEGLERYRRRHRRQLVLHHLMIADMATGRPPNAFERRMFKAAAEDEVVWRAFEQIGSRRAQPWTFFAPRVLRRIASASR